MPLGPVTSDRNTHDGDALSRAELVPRVTRSDGSFDASCSGEGVERPALWHRSDALPDPFRASVRLNRGASTPVSYEMSGLSLSQLGEGVERPQLSTDLTRPPLCLHPTILLNRGTGAHLITSTARSGPPWRARPSRARRARFRAGGGAVRWLLLHIGTHLMGDEMGSNPSRPLLADPALLAQSPVRPA